MGFLIETLPLVRALERAGLVEAARHLRVVAVRPHVKPHTRIRCARRAPALLAERRSRPVSRGGARRTSNRSVDAAGENKL